MDEQTLQDVIKVCLQGKKADQRSIHTEQKKAQKRIFFRSATVLFCVGRLCDKDSLMLYNCECDANIAIKRTILI